MGDTKTEGRKEESQQQNEQGQGQQQDNTDKDNKNDKEINNEDDNKDNNNNKQVNEGMNNNQNNNQNNNNQNNGNNKDQTEEDETNLIINYLPPTMSEGTLATLFSPYGLLERCKIVVDLQTLRSRGYGFVKYDNAISAERALNALNGYELNGKKLKVAFARKQCKAITNANLYITNVPPHFVDANLRKLFQDYGKIVECRVLMDQNVIDDKHPPLLVKLAQRRVPRRYWNSQNRNQGQQNRNQGGMGGQNKYNKNKKKKNSPGRKYYPKGNYNQMGDNNPMNMGGNMGNKQSPNKRGGYYRPRQQGGGGRQNNMGGGNKNRNQGGMGGNNQGGGPPYGGYQAPMYAQQEQFMAYQQQPAPYAANLHMTAAAMNNPNPNINKGPKRNQPIGNQWE